MEGEEHGDLVHAVNHKAGGDPLRIMKQQQVFVSEAQANLLGVTLTFSQPAAASQHDRGQYSGHRGHLPHLWQ